VKPRRAATAAGAATTTAGVARWRERPGGAVPCVPHGYNEGQNPRALDCDTYVDTLDARPALPLRQPQPV
jgi:hypothetical protein